MRTQLVVLTLSCVAATAVAQAPPEALTAVEAFHDALGRGDSAAAVAVLAEDVVIYESGGVEASRREYASHHLGSDMAFATAVSRVVVGQSSGGTGELAWVLTRSRTTGTFRGRDLDLRGTETMLLRRTPAGWRIVHIHWSSRRVPTGGG